MKLQIGTSLALISSLQKLMKIENMNALKILQDTSELQKVTKPAFDSGKSFFHI